MTNRDILGPKIWSSFPLCDLLLYCCLYSLDYTGYTWKYIQDAAIPQVAFPKKRKRVVSDTLRRIGTQTEEPDRKKQTQTKHEVS